jgi:hypothetical protein
LRAPGRIVLREYDPVVIRLVVVVAALALAPGAAAAPFHATLKGGSHSPPGDDKTKWAYTVTVTNLSGKPIPAKLTVVVVDPFGGVHPAQLDCCKTKYVTNRPFVGRFQDAVEWPPESRNFKLTFRVTVTALGKKQVLSTWVKPR